MNNKYSVFNQQEAYSLNFAEAKFYEKSGKKYIALYHPSTRCIKLYKIFEEEEFSWEAEWQVTPAYSILYSFEENKTYRVRFCANYSVFDENDIFANAEIAVGEGTFDDFTADDLEMDPKDNPFSREGDDIYAQEIF